MPTRNMGNPERQSRLVCVLLSLVQGYKQSFYEGGVETVDYLIKEQYMTRRTVEANRRREDTPEVVG